MKRRLTIISTLLLLIVVMMTLVACSGDANITDTTKMQYGESEKAIASSMLTELQTIGTTYKNRTYGTANEEAFATYVSTKLAGYGYADESKVFEYKNELAASGEQLKSKNVVFKKDALDTDKALLIVSQIDNMATYEGYNDEGIYAGATGVAIMLELAKNMREMTLPFDVYYVGLGANSMGLKGAYEFYEDFYVHHKKEDTLLMIDLSKPVGGDHMYMYTDEVSTVHGEYYYSLAKNMGYDYRPVPRNKQIMNVTIHPNQPMNYVHVGVLSSNIYFLAGGVPSVNFVSVNWEEHTSGEAIERKDNVNIAGTKRDTYDVFVKELVGEERIAKETFMVYDTIMKSTLDSEFVPTMTRARENMPDYSVWSSDGLVFGLRFGIAALFIIIAVLISSKLKKDLPQLSMEQFMSDVGANTGATPRANDVDPFEEEDPFKDVEQEFERQEKEKKDDDGSSDIFGL